MAYHGYIPLLQSYTEAFQNPSLLEVGVDKGQTMFPLVNYLSKRFHKEGQENSFLYTGIDVLIRDHVNIITDYINRDIYHVRWPETYLQNFTGFIELLEANSLKILPDIADRGNKYHIVLIDGDHNYATVSKELQYASKMVYSNGIIVCDDYHGQGGSQNEYRSDDLNFYDGEKVNLNVENLITRQNDESISKAGVKAAVDEFLYHNKEWASIQIYEKEPVLLYQPEHVHFSYKNIDPNDEERGKNITWEFKGAANV